MLIKLIAVDSYHFMRYKCKITHCPGSQTLSEYISTIVLDDNEKLSINEVLDVLIVAGIFTSTSSFGTKSLQFVTMNELKKVCTRFVFFYFLLGSSTVSNFCWNSKLLYTRRCLQEEWANASIHSAGVSGLEKSGPLERAKPLRGVRFLGRLHFALSKEKKNTTSTSFQLNR